MASPTADLTKFAQQVYLTRKGRYFDDISGTDGQVYLEQVIDWVNMFIDELETTPGPDGNLVDWWFNRENGAELGTATEGEASIDIPSTVDRLLTDEFRYVQIQQDGIVVSNWKVVAPRDITNKSDRVTEDMCAVVGTSIVFSREFKDTENNGTIVGDVVNVLPRIVYSTANDGTITATNVKILTTVKPKLLLQLGVAKNATLPDIVQGKLSPSYAQKFDNLMQAAIQRSMASSTAHEIARDSFGGVRGVY